MAGTGGVLALRTALPMLLRQDEDAVALTACSFYPKQRIGVVWAANRFAKGISKAFHPISEAICARLA